MGEANDLAAKRATLAAVEAELAAEIQNFEDSIAGLRMRRSQLRRDYADALRAELVRMSEADGTAPAEVAGELAAIEGERHPIIIDRLRELAGRYITPSYNHGP